MKDSKLSAIVKPLNNKSNKNKGGRPLKELTEDQKLAAIRYVTDSGLWKIRLATFLRVDFKTLTRILKDDKDFSIHLKGADAEFCGNLISRAKPEFILKTKYKDEFPDETKTDAENSLDERLEEFLDRAAYMTNERKRLNDNAGKTNDF